MKRIIPLIALAIVFSCGSAWAADATAAMDINSAYVWRGITVNDEAVLQPSMDVTSGGFGFNVWGNFDLTDNDDTIEEYEFSEVDLTLSYSKSVGPVGIGVGIIEYMFPLAGDGTRELYLSLDYEIISGLSASLATYWDTDEVNGSYTSLGLSYAMNPTEALEVSIGGSVAYADEKHAEFYSGGTDGGFHDYALTLGASYAVTDALSIGAGITYTDTMDEDVLAEEVADTNTYGGISISYAF